LISGGISLGCGSSVAQERDAGNIPALIVQRNQRSGRAGNKMRGPQGPPINLVRSYCCLIDSCFCRAVRRLHYWEISDYPKMSAIDSHSRSNLGSFANPGKKVICWCGRLPWDSSTLRSLRLGFLSTRRTSEGCLPKPAKSNGFLCITFRRQCTITNLPDHEKPGIAMISVDIDSPEDQLLSDR
jgi:hypothetical protein